MKIAILTQPLGHNYGGVLQNYALQQILIKLGHDPKTLEKDYRQYITIFRLFFELPKRIFTKYILKKRDYIFSEKKHNKIIITSKKLLPFVTKYINHKYIKDYSLKNINEYDSIIVGSDQVWRPIYNQGVLDKMFLSFIPKNYKIKRIAYAASFGTAEWEYSEEQASMCKDLIKTFDAVSTREIDGIDLCRKHLNQADVVSVLDPTFLLEKEDYTHLCKSVASTKDDLLFAYILDIEYNTKSLLDKIAEEKGLKLKLFSADSNCALSIEEWLAMFRDAKMVITDSFHGTVFSIIFNKEFYTIANQSRGGSRFTSLLSQLLLTNRMLVDVSNITLNDCINWPIVNEKLNLLKSQSLNFLITNLS